MLHVVSGIAGGFTGRQPVTSWIPAPSSHSPPSPSKPPTKAVNAFSKGAQILRRLRDKLVVQLELERFRLQTWGANAGLVGGSLAPTLLLVHETLVRQLDLIKSNFGDADRLRERYELNAATPEAAIDSAADGTAGTKDGDRVSTFVARRRKSLRRSGVGFPNPPIGGLGGRMSNQHKTGRATMARKLMKRKAMILASGNGCDGASATGNSLRSLSPNLHDHISTLNQLLTETQQRKGKEDSERIKIIVAGSAVDESSLSLIRSAVGVGDALETHAMAGRKAPLREQAVDGASSHRLRSIP